MSKIDKNTLGYLGAHFQIKLLAAILNDTTFASRIMEILDPNSFEEPTMKKIALTIKEAYEKGEVHLNADSLQSRMLEDTSTTMNQEYVINFTTQIKEVDFIDIDWVKDRAIAFCKLKTLKKACKEVEKIADSGDLDKLSICADIVTKATQKGDVKSTGVNVGDNIDTVLADDYRQTIATGIKGLDVAMDGGLARGELGLFLAAYGVGKSTILTKIANEAKNQGYNVLQIFFEDSVSSIQRKHYACWTNYEMNSFGSHKEEIKRIVTEELIKPGKIQLVRLSSDGTTIAVIKQYIRKLISQGFKPDVIVLDYIDVIAPSKKVDNSLIGEGVVMREFESMLVEFNMVGWTACQGNREAIDAEIIGGKHMGGSIKKGQIAHFIATIARDQQQQEANTATMAIIKSRFSQAGKLFENILFDNSRVQIVIEEHKKVKSTTQHSKYVDRQGTERVNFVLEHAKKNKEETQEDELMKDLIIEQPIITEETNKEN